MSYASNVSRAAVRNQRREQSANMWDRIARERLEIRERNERNVAEAIDALVSADPEGEAWFDNDLPDFNIYDTVQVRQAISTIYAHIAEVVARALPTRGSADNGTPPVANTPIS